MSLPSIISFSAMSAFDIRGPTSTRGRCPMVNCRTRLDTRLTSKAVLGMTLEASSRSWLDIIRVYLDPAKGADGTGRRNVGRERGFVKDFSLKTEDKRRTPEEAKDSRIQEL